MIEIRASTVLPARRENIVLRTADGLDLVGELARPPHRAPVATLVCLHPLPTAGGMMDSHVLRKASYRLPALADLAVLRFNTRGTSSERGTSEGEFGERRGRAARRGRGDRVLPSRPGCPGCWLLGWSFGTELALMWGNVPEVEGAILLSPAAAPGGRRRPGRLGGDAGGRCWRWSPSSMTTCGPTRRGPGSPGCRRPSRGGASGPSTCGWASRTSVSC